SLFERTILRLTLRRAGNGCAFERSFDVFVEVEHVNGAVLEVAGALNHLAGEALVIDADLIANLRASFVFIAEEVHGATAFANGYLASIAHWLREKLVREVA